MTTIPIYIGYDPREAVAFHVLCHSILAGTRARVQFIPISGTQGAASNRFHLIRFDVARMAEYRGRAIYMDSDMLLMPGVDIQELYELAEPGCAVSVAQHHYMTRYRVKYWGQENKDYPRKNWSSLQVIDCEAWKQFDLFPLTAEDLHRFRFIKDEMVGRLPLEWNWLAGEYDHNEKAKLVHFTLGIPPLFDYDVSALAYIAEWWKAYGAAMRASETP